MSTSTLRKLQALILGGTGLFLMQKIWSNTLYWYINSRYLVLILLAAVYLLVLTQVLISTFRNDQKEKSEINQSKHEPASPYSVWTLMIVALPLIIGLLIPARPLGASAIANRGLRSSISVNIGDADSASLKAIPANSRTILDWLRLYDSDPTYSEFMGAQVDIIGFIYHDPRLQSNQLVIGRFALTCCVADAFAIGLVVEIENADQFSNNSWVRVQGEMSTIEIDGESLPFVLASQFDPIGEPLQPYLLP